MLPPLCFSLVMAVWATLALCMLLVGASIDAEHGVKALGLQ